MQIDLKNGPATFQQMNCELFWDLEYLRVYIDNLIVFWAL